MNKKNTFTSALVTGAAGFIGSHLTDSLLQQGLRVVGLDNLSTCRLDNLKHARDMDSFHFVNESLQSYSGLEDLVGQCDVIYHLSATVGVNLLISEPVNSLENNVAGTLRLCQLAGRHQKHLFFASSSEVYGKSENGVLNENRDITLGTPEILRWGYGCSKALGEFLIMGMVQQFNSPFVIGRYFNTCGPRQIGQYGMVIPRFIQAALTGKPLIVYGDGKQVRTFTAVEDTVRATRLLIESPETRGQVFNIGSENVISIMELAEMIVKMTCSKSPIIRKSYTEIFGDRFEDMKFRIPDVTKIRQATGYRAQITLREILEKAIRFWQKRLSSDR